MQIPNLAMLRQVLKPPYSEQEEGDEKGVPRKDGFHEVCHILRLGLKVEGRGDRGSQELSQEANGKSFRARDARRGELACAVGSAE